MVWAATALTLLVLACLWLLVDQSVRVSMRDAAEAQVDVDLSGLVDIYASGGQADLKRRIDDRLALITVDGNTAHYLLATDAGSPIAGDIVDWPALDPAVSEAGYVTIGEGTRVFARATQLGPDLRLVVAREVNGGDVILRRILLVFAGGGAVAMLLVVLSGRLAASRLQHRIGDINHALRTQEPDALAAISNLPRRDEVDELAANSAVALGQVARLMEAYRDTSDQLAHEIRTPLMHLDRRLALALEAGTSADITERLVTAREEIRRLVGMLESLLDIASSKARRGDRRGLEPLDLTALLTRICELYADSAEESGHAFEWHIAPDVEIDGEPMQLSRMVTNLLDNAFKYVPSGGKVQLVLEPGPVLVIADDGPGILAAERDQVFDRFRRGTLGRESESGSGLGLALARAIAERHGYALTLDDTEQGASFRMARARGSTS